MGGRHPHDAHKRCNPGMLAAGLPACALKAPQIGLDQGQRKEGRPQLARQFGHMLPAGGMMAAGIRAKLGQETGEFCAAGTGKERLWLPPRREMAQRQRQPAAGERRRKGKE